MRLSRSLRRAVEPAAFELIEEAVHLLRRAPPGWLARYYAGVSPFVLGLLFFWAHLTWFRPGGAAVAWAALGLAALFVIMKAAQSEFCARLLALRIDAPPPACSWRRLAQLAGAQQRVQPWALLALGPALVLTVPFGWVFAYGQSATVIGSGETLHGDAVTQAKLWPEQNHLGLLLISGVALCLWLNFGAVFYAVPWLANRLLGIENLFNFSGWSFFNTTFLAATLALAWLAVDPLIKAFYTLRVFHGRARHTGEDLRLELHRDRRSAGTAIAVWLLVFLLGGGPFTRADAAEPPRTNVVQPAQLDRAIDDVLAGGDFPWRLRPAPREVETATDGPVSRFLRQGADLVGEMARSISGWVRSAAQWFVKYFFPRDTGSESSRGGPGAMELLKLLLYVFVGGAILLLVWLVWLMWRNGSRHAGPVTAAHPLPAPAPDLGDENAQASQLPAGGWIALAREQAARGEWRLALRALYLATLAQLAADGLLSLAKFKTNLDYERELRRRTLARAEIVVRFATRRRTFEDAWYGQVRPGEADVRDWLAELERSVPP